MSGNSPLVAQHALAFDGENKADQQFAGVGVRRAFGKNHRVHVGDHRLVENILHRTALGFNARRDVGVGVGDGVEFTGGEELRRDVMTIAHGRLLGGERFQKITRFCLCPSAAAS